MTIESTAHPQARHKPYPAQASHKAAPKKIKKQSREPKPSHVVISKKTAPFQSRTTPGYLCFYGVHVNKKDSANDLPIIFLPSQLSWVEEQREAQTVLYQDEHFSDVPGHTKTDKGWETRTVLHDDCTNEYVDEDDLPAHWGEYTEVPVVQNEKPKDPPKAPPADPEVMRRIDTWLRVLAECGVEPSHDRIAETAAGFCTSVEISKERRGSR